MKNKVKSAKSKYKNDKKEYDKAFNEAYKYSRNHPIGQITNQAKKSESNRLWGNVYDKNKTLEKSRSDYKNVKKERKNEINKVTDKLKKESSFGEKLVYNDAVRKKAAKYVVDNNMSINDAYKKAKGAAWRNSAALVAASSAVSIASLYSFNKKINMN